MQCFEPMGRGAVKSSPPQNRGAGDQGMLLGLLVALGFGSCLEQGQGWAPGDLPSPKPLLPLGDF